MKLFSKKTLWALAFAAAVLVLTPGAGFCVEEDLYIYRLLFGRVYFEYETGTTEDNGSSRDHDRFIQSYSLDTLGNILSRRLIIYDAGFSFTSNAYEQDTTTIDIDTVNYYLKTTLLPKSNIPLDLYANQMNETLTTSTVTERMRRIYGLNWLMRFRTLPDTRIKIERQNDATASSDNSTTMYSVNMTKSIGPTENALYFNMNTSTNNLQDGKDSQSKAINLSNSTHLSRSTLFNIGVARGDSSNESPENPDTTVNALTIGLQSAPSVDFRQEHRYTFYSNTVDDSQSDNGTYSGSMSYRFTDRLSSSLSLSAAESSSETPDKTESSESLGAGFGINYQLSQKLSLSETVSYSKSDTTSDTATNLDRETFRALTNLNYNDQLKRAHLSASASLGYNMDKTSDELSGSGIEQGLSVALTNIDVNRYFLFNTSANWNKVYNLTGDVWSDNSSYQMSAFSRLWRRYVLLSASFSASTQSSWISASESDTEEWSLNAVSSYFRNTKIEAGSEHKRTFDTVTGEVTTSSDILSVTHNRYVAGGFMDLGFVFNIISNTFEGGSNNFTTTSMYARYSKKLMRNLDWLASASVSHGTGNNDTFKNVNALTNLLTYQLRSWLLSGEHKYIQTQDQNRDLTESTFIFRATRGFTWML